MYSGSVEALSPVDGRYASAVAELRARLSEGALIRERIRIEAAWLLHLATEVPQLPAARLPDAVRARALALTDDPGAEAASAVKTIEARINHDVKAVEYFVRDALGAAGAAPATLELVHFGCTSEDINNVAYARLLLAARDLMLRSLADLRGTLAQLAARHADLAMLAHTHGQPASPTTLGKEFANVVARLRRADARWSQVAILGKWNGAVGNFNAHAFAVPDADWPAIGRSFVESLGLQWNGHTTQIEPHDWIGEYCDAVAAANVILLDLCRDAWGYISIGYLRQRTLAGEVGSSTMPHKVNPIDFENAEGNLGVANALLRHFSEKLPVSRWQRDLSDSTVLRNLGVALGHTAVAWRSLGRGLGKIEPDPVKLAADLDGAWEVLAEAVQSLLRARGVPGGYEKLKDFSRGRTIDAVALRDLIDSLPLDARDRERLRALRPTDYTGLAAALVRLG
ncbi:MAG: adenylosuccinate lyase [Steroidobacteraceae bacterium]